MRVVLLLQDGPTQAVGREYLDYLSCFIEKLSHANIKQGQCQQPENIELAAHLAKLQDIQL